MNHALRSAIIVSAFLLTGGCSPGGEAAKPAAADALRPPVAVETALAVTGSLTTGIDVTGSLAPKFEVDVKSEVTGLVREIFITEWIRVEQGAPLAKIDPREQEALAKRAEAALESAKASLLQARAADNRARREFDRLKQLKESGLATQQALDEAGSEAEAAASRVEAAAAQVRVAREDLDQAVTRLSKCLIVAPMAGIVSERRANVGDLVGETGANQLLFHIVDNRLLNLTVTVPSAEMAGLRPGQPLEFSTDALPGRTFQGTVMFINPAVSPADRSLRVIAEVKNPTGELKGGLFVKGRIVTGSRAGILLVPRDALSAWDVAGRKARLFVAAGDRASLREVRTGLVTESGVEVVSGLKPGETYIIRGAFNVKEGDRLLIARPKGA